jgi:hypothetical protein
VSARDWHVDDPNVEHPYALGIVPVHGA